MSRQEDESASELTPLLEIVSQTSPHTGATSCNEAIIIEFGLKPLKLKPIHSAAYNADLDEMKRIEEEQAGSVHSLTIFSDNALHILLRDRSEQIYPECTSHFNIHETMEHVSLCADFLINSNIDINHPNIWNEAPIHLAEKYNYDKVLEELKHLNEDSPADDDFSKNAFTYLKSGNEDAFLKSDIQDIVESNEYNDVDGVTMLQLCFIRGFKAYLDDVDYKNELANIDIRDSPMLRIFKSDGLKRCIEHLLDNEASFKVKSTGFNILLGASNLGYYPFVAMLLGHNKNDMKFDDIFDVLSKLRIVELKNHKHYGKFVVYLLLNKLIAIKSTNEILTTDNVRTLNRILCEFISDDRESKNNEIICMLLYLGASLAHEEDAFYNSASISVIERIHPEILKSHLDDCINNNSFDCRTIIQDDDSFHSETRILNCLIRNRKNLEILLHPLFIYFIHEKWSRIKFIIYSNLALLCSLLLIIYVHIICCVEQINSPFINCFLYVLLSLNLVKKCIQIWFLYKLNHKWNFTSNDILEFLTIMCSLMNLNKYNIYSAIISIFAATSVCLSTSKTFPGMTNYMSFFDSWKYLIKFAVFCLILLTSFGICFYSLFPPQKSSSLFTLIINLINYSFLTLRSMVGDFNLFDKKPVDELVGNLIAIIFVIFMTVIFNNILIGFMVVNMERLKKIVETERQVEIATFIRNIDVFVKYLLERKIDLFTRYIKIDLFGKDEIKILHLNEKIKQNIFSTDDILLMKDTDAERYSFDISMLGTIYDSIQR